MRGGARAKRSGCSHALKEAACGTERGAASAPCMRAPLAARCCALRCALAALHSHPKTTTPLHATQNKGRTPARRPGRLPRRATPPRRGGAAAPSPRAPPARRSTTCSASPPPRRSATSKRRTARRRSSCTPTSTRRCAAARKGGGKRALTGPIHTHTHSRAATLRAGASPALTRPPPPNLDTSPCTPPSTWQQQPDAEQRFMEVKAAFAVLSDPQQRADYDRRQRAGVSAGSART